MNTVDEDRTPSRTPWLVAGGVVLLVLAVAGSWLLLRQPAAAPVSPAPVAAAPAPTPTLPPPVAAAPEPAPPVPEPSRRAPKPKPARTVAEPAPAPALMLKVDSDVPGASVFIDRVYVGTTPLTTSEVTAGTHTLNVSAEGYETQASTIELISGPSEVMVRFKIVRLNEALPVVHKHAIGSCEGRLLAEVNGLTYETSNKEHAFHVPFAQIKSFEIDYLKKNLRVTRVDGKTFNFTDRTPNADALFVFHKKVAAVRAKLASGMAP